MDFYGKYLCLQLPKQLNEYHTPESDAMPHNVGRTLTVGEFREVRAQERCGHPGGLWKPLM